MYYISIDDKDTNKLQYYCRNCGNKDNEMGETGGCILNTQLKTVGKHKFAHIINKYSKYDPTLPRIHNIPCPNAQCGTNTTEKTVREVIYIRYDDENLKYLYMCTTCDEVW
jgi:DNA-directed RNA polymerase subunit M/transcription elongation factor TFIIS